MRVMNPNARELPVKAIKYRIEVNGTEFAAGPGGHTLRGAGAG